jgi:hypothetical protein
MSAAKSRHVRREERSAKPRIERYLRSEVLDELFTAEGITGYRTRAIELGLGHPSVLHRYAGPNPIPATGHFIYAVTQRFPSVPLDRLFEDRVEVPTNARRAA